MKRLLRTFTILLLVCISSSCSSSIQKIEHLFNEQKYEDAISDLNQYLFFHVTDVKALHLRARSYEEIGELEKSKADYERIILIDDQYAQAYAGLGKLLFDQKDYINAELKLLRAAMLDSEDFNILYLLGRTMIMTEKYKKAEEFLRMATKLDPDYAKAYYYTGMALAFQGDALGCAGSFNAYVSREPDNLVGIYNRGFAYMRAGYIEWALEDFDAVLKEKPNHIEAMAQKGICMTYLGDSKGCELIQTAAKKGSELAKAQLENCFT
ncbi:tetratricopeptide repeat protein [Algoriphagus ratkowskyi]|uniref:Tetratricopeptide repeat protein n=1 Tax=Algoriphagus ratkowskyi TaxID=57028 RepID=A0A2W7RSN1_9BACT|nr:tetratricopeptide repeat protein [Algoriphagus ratkowskyi]PZX53855.1 tetratricopeptide repeat protein [Algoriphagus ratkowskyi]TXD76740.1 tetratricopeptide repeat protein [Algoriphagus ratkowskyi]